MRIPNPARAIAGRLPGLPAPLAEALPVWFVTRLAVLVVGYIGVMAVGFPGRLPWAASDDPLLNLLARWDTGWYLPIAERGYAWPPSGPGGQSEVVFFPLYPLLIRFGSLLLGGRPLLAGWLVSMGAFLWALVYLYRLARLHLDDDGASAALILLASYPFAVYYSAVYTESLFLLCLVAGVFHAVRGEAGRTGAWGLLAGLARPTGFVLAVPLTLLAVMPALLRLLPRARPWLIGSQPPVRERPSPGRGAQASPAGDSFQAAAAVRPALVVAALMPAVGVGVYSAYVYTLTGDPFTWSTLQAAWGKPTVGFSAIADTLRAIHGLGVRGWIDKPIDALNELAAAFVLVAAWPVLRRFGAGYALLLLLTLLPALMSGGVRSLGRYTAPLFPVFLWLAAAVPPGRRGLWVFAFALLQAVVALLFFSWRPMM